MYHNYLNTENAQKIADGIMKIIPYDIYIMDTEGVILASGDKEKLGSIHREALTALSRKEAYIVQRNTENEHQGINLPIFYNNQIVGVIGIYGKIEDIMPIGQICMAIALLMIENQVLNEMTAIKESRLKDFLYDWISLPREQYSSSFYDQANFLGIDLNIPRTAVVIKSSRIRFSVMENIRHRLLVGEFIVRQGIEEMLILLKTDARLESRMEKIMELSKDLEYCYVGESYTDASKSVKSVVQTARIAENLGIRNKILKYSQVFLECLLDHVEVAKELEDIISLFGEKDSDGVLKETLYAYVEDNDNYTEICEKLHIHRNTLNYRLAKIEEVFGKNPRKAKDLMLLYISVIKMESQKN